MNRQAIILSSSPQRNPVPSVHFDASTFDSFLRSNLGGAWISEEIFRAENASRDQINTALRRSREADYSLLFFAGHGDVVKMDRPWTEMRLFLASGETITERELNPGSRRCTLMFDCCRRAAEQIAPGRLAEPSGPLPRGKDSSWSRTAYEQSLSAAEAGLVKMFAVGTDRIATGGNSFTQYLIKETIRWAAENKGVLTLDQALSLATNAMEKNMAEQKADYRGGRRLRHFPFAVQE